MSSLEGVKPGDTIIACYTHTKDHEVTVQKVGRVWVHTGDARWADRYRIIDGCSDEGSLRYAMTVHDYAAKKKHAAAESRFRDLGLTFRNYTSTGFSTELLTAICDLIERYREQEPKDSASKRL